MDGLYLLLLAAFGAAVVGLLEGCYRLVKRK